MSGLSGYRNADTNASTNSSNNSNTNSLTLRQYIDVLEQGAIVNDIVVSDADTVLEQLTVILLIFNSSSEHYLIQSGIAQPSDIIN